MTKNGLASNIYSATLITSIIGISNSKSELHFWATQEFKCSTFSKLTNNKILNWKLISHPKLHFRSLKNYNKQIKVHQIDYTGLSEGIAMKYKNGTRSEVRVWMEQNLRNRGCIPDSNCSRVCLFCDSFKWF